MVEQRFEKVVKWSKIETNFNSAPQFYITAFIMFFLYLIFSPFVSIFKFIDDVKEHLKRDRKVYWIKTK